ncbi:M28 family peptidase [Proteiniphilum sp. UBA5384]|uniref:M28 family peptidase n=1 Tax=Proteiniphilum sp. UBA5384 TaxID=1947279 RepID=UPI0025CFEA8B|nr:M28 family peptidase [Proteiniphilum sp. UBA5384]
MKQVGNFFILMLFIAGVLFSISCNSCQSKKGTLVMEPYRQVSPDFNADSAYVFVAKQVGFGPRVPGSTAHKACGDYLVSKLSEFGAQVTEQKAEIIHYDGRDLYIRNIIGSYHPEKERRVLLFAHWDTRPFADEEPDAGSQYQPIAGADDGASGVGVLLEIARSLHHDPVERGVDIIFFDMEDWGQPSFETDWVQGEWWCRGSQYWSEQPHVENYKAEYGILLDMVGSANATFLKEGYSKQYAPAVLEKVWSIAAKLGYGNYFQSKNGGYITDDHLLVNRHHRAPSINIINLRTDSHTGFVQHWHTHRDDMRNIDRNSLKVVGQTVMELIYSEPVKID